MSGSVWAPRHEPLPARNPAPLDNLRHDSQPLRVGQPYDVLMEHAVRRGECVGYGVPAMASGEDADLVSLASITPRTSSPEPSASTHRFDEHGKPTPELLAEAVARVRAYRQECERARSHPGQTDAYATHDQSDKGASDDGNDADPAPLGQKRKRQRQRGGGGKRGPAHKNAAHNAGHCDRGGKNNASHAGRNRRNKEKKRRERESTRGKPYDRVHNARFYRNERPVYIISLETLDVVYDTTASGYTNKAHHYKIRGRCWTDADTARAGYTHFKWKGDESLAVIDASDVVVACLLASPKDQLRPPWEQFDACGPRLAAVIGDQVRTSPAAWTKGLGSRRGDFCSLTLGINYNYTAKRPANLVLDNQQKAVADVLLNNEDFRRVMGHASEGFAHFFPRAFEHSCDRMRDLHALLPDLCFPCDNSLYPTVTVNGGPQTAAYEHADVGNYPGHPCFVYSAGDYDHTKSARFVMHDLRLVVDFPPYRTILVSSAGVRHSNTPLQAGETRYSIAGYMSGSLMRYAAYGGNVGGIPKDIRERMDEEFGETWSHQQARLSNFWDLEEDREALFIREKERARASTG